MRWWATIFLLAIVGSAAARVQLGDETLAQNGFKELRGKRIGLLTNRSGVNGNGTSTIDLLRRAPGVRLVALFAPEHGLRGEMPAGVEFPNRLDPRTGLMVYSLYGPGPVRRPTREMLGRIEAMVYDVQDAGCRSYTFISTMGLAMESCAEAGVEFIVLDRPNPVGGLLVEGPMLEPRFRSMVGQWPIPYVYGMTCGELARMINGEGWIGKHCRLTVVPMKRWERKMVWRDTGLPWTPTSPNIPKAESPLFYASTGMLGWFGGVQIGIHETFPFECMAASWLNGPKLSRALERDHLRGVKFQPFSFRPKSSGTKGRSVSGVRVRFTSPATAPKLAISIYALEAIKRVSGRDLPAECARQKRSFAMLDKLAGTDALRRQLLSGKPAREIVGSWRSGEAAFLERRGKYLIYP